MPQPLAWSDLESAGLDPEAIGRLDDELRQLAEAETDPAAPAIAWTGGRSGRVLEPRYFGKVRLDATDRPGPETLFLVASITKPFVVAAALKMVESGRITLDDPLARWVPEFDSGDPVRRSVTARHLMTHTSGLPDQLPSNEALRQAHSPLSVFVAETCRAPLLFPPGTRVRYQSMGTLMLAELIERVAGRSIHAVLDQDFFQPLGMTDTSLGLGRFNRDRVAHLRVASERDGLDWNWNGDYWLKLGAPWGGLLTTPADLARFAVSLLDETDRRFLRRASIRAMTRNQLAYLPEIPEPDRRCRPWGLGWRLAWPGHSAHFGDLVGPGTYGHWGATGSVLWIDPDADAFFILFTNAELDDHSQTLARASNQFMAALR